MLVSSAEVTHSSVHRPLALCVLFQSLARAACAGPGGEGRGAPRLQLPAGPEDISSFRVFVSLSVKRAEGNCPFPLNELAAEDEKCCTEGRCDYIAENHRSVPALPCAGEGERGFAGGLADQGSPTGCSLLELSMVQSNVQGDLNRRDAK